MTFAAMAAWQGWLLAAIAVAVAVGVFLLKLRPPQIVVASLTLWRRVLDERRDLTLWERIRRAVSLAAVVAITLAMVAAILRPQPSAAAAKAGGPSGRVAIVIDSSWSMLAATSSGQTRWDRAVARARTMAAGAGGDEIVLATTADGVVEGPTPDAALIEASLDRIAPSGGEGTPWPSLQGARVTYFLTDGAVARPLDAGIAVESVFEAAANVAITAFDVRPSSAPESAGQAFLEVANYAPVAQDVRIVLARGAASILDVHVQLPAGGATQRVVPLDRAGESRLRARVSSRENALVVDDEAVASIPGARPLAVAVVSDEPVPLMAFLNRDPDVKPAVFAPQAYKPGAEDVVIFDRVVPPAAPSKPALVIAPRTASWLGQPGAEEREPQWVASTPHPMVQSVDLFTMPLLRARSFAGPGLEAIAVSAAGTPLLLVTDAPDRRIAVFTFGVGESKLMFDAGFPVLMANALEWLGHPVPSGTRRPGPAVFPGAIGAIVGPNGQPVPVTRFGRVSIATLARLGFYDVSAGGGTSVIAVNAGDPQTSDLRRTRLQQAAVSENAQAHSRGRPWWLFAVAAALLLVAAEWWTWQRRITV